MTHFEEGYLAFDFGPRWQVIKLDEHRDYRERIEKLTGTKAVDFLGIFDNRELYITPQATLKSGVLMPRCSVTQKEESRLSCG